jgi:hypothetical protein
MELQEVEAWTRKIDGRSSAEALAMCIYQGAEITLLDCLMNNLEALPHGDLTYAGLDLQLAVQIANARGQKDVLIPPNRQAFQRATALLADSFTAYLTCSSSCTPVNATATECPVCHQSLFKANYSKKKVPNNLFFLCNLRERLNKDNLVPVIKKLKTWPTTRTPPADGHLLDWWDSASAKFLTLSNSSASLVPGQSTTSAYRPGAVLPPSVARPWLSPKLGDEAFVFNADGYQAFKKRTSVSMDSGYYYFYFIFSMLNS